MEVLQDTYKDTKIGRIPKDWEVKTLEDVFIFNNGKGHEQFISENGDYIVVNSKFISQEGRVKKFSNKQMSPLLVKDITMVMSDIPNGRALAKCFLIEENNKYSLNQRICGLRLKNEANDDVRFFFYNLNRNKGFLKYNDGVSQTNLRKSEVLGCLLAYPPSKEQLKIADILSTVDEQISTTDKIIEKSKELKKGLMQKLFSEGIGHTEFKDTKIGRIPKDWEVKTLEDVFHFNNGKGHEQFIEENGDYIVVNSKFISREGRVKKFSNKQMSPLLVNDITMVMSDVPNGKALAKCFLIEKNNRYSLNQRICGLRLKDEEKDNVNFFFYNLNRNKGFLKYNDGVSQTNLRKSEVLGCLLAYPSNEEQQKIAGILLEAGAKIEKEQTQKAQLQALKKGLMQQLLTGKKRVKV
jgi:type I restriction enzyme S subunit